MIHDQPSDCAAANVTYGSNAAVILTSPGFILAVGLLLVNDWVLKSAVGNWWTGKLSDFAGLYAFSLFCTAFLPRRRGAIFLLTSVAFLLWKSPLSGPLITAWNAFGVWPIVRVVDYTDWIALAALVPAYWSAEHSSLHAPAPGGRRFGQVTAVGVGAFAMLAFMATSRPMPYHYLDPREGHIIGGSRAEVYAALRDLGWNPWSSHRPGAAAADTLTGGGTIRQQYAVLVGAFVELKDAPTCGTTIILFRVASTRRNPDLDMIRRTFATKLVEPLQSRFDAC